MTYFSQINYHVIDSALLILFIYFFCLAEVFVNQLLTKEALDQPSDDVKPDELEMRLPDDFDEEKFNR